jgi:hypothetical protein
VYGVIGAAFFSVSLLIAVAVGAGFYGLITKVRGILDESVVPTLGSVKEAADTVRGTTEFVSRTAVTPVAKAYGTFAGVKRGLSVLAGLRGREKK